MCYPYSPYDEIMEIKSSAVMFRRLFEVVGVAIFYFLAAQFGFFAALPPGDVIALWPPAALSLAAMLMLGWHTGPGIFIGALVVALTTLSGENAVGVALAIAAGVTLQAGVGAWLLRRLVASIPPKTTRETLLAIGASLLAAVISAIIVPASLSLGNFLSWNDFAPHVWVTWVGDAAGILLFAPALVLLTALFYQKKNVAEPFLWMLSGFILGLALIICFAIQNAEQQRLLENLQNDTVETGRVLADTINEHDMQALSGIRAFLAAAGDVSRAQFETYTRPFITQYTSAAGLTWAPRITQAERAAFELSMQQDMEGFAIFEKDASGQKIPVLERAEYYPVMFIEPFDQNKSVVGFDNGSSPARLDALLLARDSADNTITAPINLLQDSQEQVGILLVMPIYKNNQPVDTLDARRANLKGFAIGSFRMDDLVNHVLSENIRQDLEFYFYDVDVPGQPVFLAFHPSISGPQTLAVTGAPSVAAIQTGLYRTATISVGNRRWLIVARPGVNYGYSATAWMAWLSLALGILLVGLFLSYVNRRHLVESILTRSEEEFRSLSDYALSGIVRIDTKGRVMYANLALARIFGFDSPKSLVGQDIRQYLVDQDEFSRLMSILLSEKKIENQEIEVVTATGERRHLLFSASFYAGVVSGMVMDVTERIHAEKQIRQLSGIVAQMADNVVITDIFGVIEYVNPAFEQLTGYSSAEAIGNTPRILKSGQRGQEYYTDLWETILRGEVFQDEMVNRKKNGDLYYEVKTITPIRNTSGKITHFVATGKDITERKQVEEKLRQKESEYRLIAENTADVIWILDLESQHFVYVSPSVEKLRGYTPQEVLSQTMSDALTPESLEAVVKELPARLEAFTQRKQEITRTDELDQYRKDGSIVHTEVSTTLVVNDTGKLQVVGISRDIGERKLAREKILRLNRLYATLSQINQTIVRTERASTLFEEICRIAVEYGQFRMAWIGLIDESYGVVKPAYFYGEELGYLTNVKIKYLDEALGRGPTGTAIRTGRCVISQDIANDQTMAPWREPALQRGYLSAAAVPFFRNNQVIGSLTVYASDAQAFDSDEEELLEEIGHDISFALDFIDANTQRQQAVILQETAYHIAEAAQLAGSLQELYPQIHHQIASVMNVENFYIALYDQVNNLLQFPYSVDVIYPFRAPVPPGQGLAAHVLQTGKPLFFLGERGAEGIEVIGQVPKVWMGVPLMVQGKTIGVMAVQHYTDPQAYTEREMRMLEFVSAQVATAIDRKQAHETLQKSQASLETAQAIARLGSWELDLVRGAGLFWSKEMYSLFRQDPREGVPSLDEFMKLVHPDDRQQLLDAQQRAIETGALITLEYRAYPAGSAMRYFRASIQAIQDANQQLLHMSGTVLDITESRLMELAIQERVKELTCLFHVSRVLDDRQATVKTVCNRIVEYIVPAMQFPHLAIPVLTLDGTRYTIDRFDESLVNHLSAIIEVNNKQRGTICVFYIDVDAPFLIPEEQDMLWNIARMLGLWVEQREAEVAVRTAQHELEELNRELEKRVEERTAEVRRSEATYRALFENSNDGIFIISSTGEDLSANRQALTMLGYTLEEYLSLPRNAVATPEQVLDAEARFAAVMRGEYVPLYERTLIGKNGKSVDVEINLSPVRDPSGNIIMVQSVVRDISERKKAEEALRESRDKLSAANAALEKASRLKDEFLASMSHELRTPLTGILGLSEALQLQTYGTLTEKQLKALRNIETSGRHLLDLINDILDLSKIEAGKLDMQFEPCQAAELCQASLHLVKGMAHQKRQNIGFNIDPAAITIRADARRLKQMLVNLLSNAVKFTPEGGKLGLEVIASEAEASVTFTVWDKGIGIKQEEMGKLFKPFVQLDSSLARQYSGTGLGLSLVQRMAELHGGSIKVESAPGEGSRFSIILPWQPRMPQPISESVSTDSATLKNTLVIEDNDLDAEQVTRYLNEFGLQNVVHPTIRGALEKAAFLHPGVILLDLNLPDGPGLGLLALLKSDQRTFKIPVIIASVEERRSEAQQMGAVGYLVKPFSKEDLRQELSKVAPVISPESVMVISATGLVPLVMLADDNELILQTISDFLEAKGFRVLSTRSGFELLARAPEFHPDIILVDIQMPGMDGMETMRRLRAHSDRHLAQTPIIAVTALAMTGDREKCLEAGANDYISKPIVLTKLVEQIKSLLSKRTH